METAEGHSKPGSDSDAAGPVDQAGRPLGPRALQTRQRILDATVAELEQKSMRDLRVIDIARRVGSSPATFYQYFKDVEDVVLYLSERVTTTSPEVVEIIRERDWHGPEGYALAKEFVEAAIVLRDREGAVLRVRNNAADEGDERFNEVRIKAIMPMITAFAEEIARSQKRARDSGAPNTSKESNSSEDGEWIGGPIDPMTAAMAIFSFVDRLSMYHEGMEAFGPTHANVVDTAASMMQALLTSQR